MTSPPNPPPADVPALLRRLIIQDPGRPRVTWYGPGGERVELSAKVLDNWVAKTANLLVDELDAGPGTRIRVLLPAHWRAVVWVLAAWSVGAQVLVPAAGAPDPTPATGPRDDIVVGSDADRLAHTQVRGGAPRLVAVALGALALGFGPGLPPDAVDAAEEVRRYGDVFVTPVRPATGDPAFTVGQGPTVSHGALLGTARAAAAAAGWAAGVRLATPCGVPHAVDVWLAALAAPGSVVLLGDPAGQDAATLGRLGSQEGVNATHR